MPNSRDRVDRLSTRSRSHCTMEIYLALEQNLMTLHEHELIAKYLISNVEIDRAEEIIPTCKIHHWSEGMRANADFFGHPKYSEKYLKTENCSQSFADRWQAAWLKPLLMMQSPHFDRLSDCLRGLIYSVRVVRVDGLWALLNLVLSGVNPSAISRKGGGGRGELGERNRG